jgi:hypothetical protein
MKRAFPCSLSAAMEATCGCRARSRPRGSRDRARLKYDETVPVVETRRGRRPAVALVVVQLALR